MIFKKIIQKGIQVSGGVSGRLVQTTKNITDKAKDNLDEAKNNFLESYLHHTKLKCSKCGESFAYPEKIEHGYDPYGEADADIAAMESVDSIRKHGMCRSCYSNYVVDKTDSRAREISKMVGHKMSSLSAGDLEMVYGVRWKNILDYLINRNICIFEPVMGYYIDENYFTDSVIEDMIMRAVFFQVYEDDKSVANRYYDNYRKKYQMIYRIF